MTCVLVGGTVAGDAKPAAGRGPEDGPERVLRAYVHATLSTDDVAGTEALTCRRPALADMQSWQQDLRRSRQRFALPRLAADVMSYHAITHDGLVTAETDVAVTLVRDGRPEERLTRPFTFT
ncbi:hypothetical protein AB0M20_45180, partial [Actinoplanes sp. NPDC051633]|uniref:hypothetical protein n=1 Tax=Actinoplanes sp. NPDC051633 TaxID=3155670 RepID=UPI00341F2643